MSAPQSELPPSIILPDACLTDCDPSNAFDSITRVAVHLFDVPVALISIVEEHKDRQFFASQQGLEDPVASARQTPLSHSFCRHVKAQKAPLIVSNAPKHPLLKDNLAIRDLKVMAYLGVPISQPSGEVIGAICVINNRPREWSDADIAKLQDLAVCVNDEIALRASITTISELHVKLEDRHAETLRYTAMRESITQAFMIPDLEPKDRFRQMLQASCNALGMDSGVIATIEENQPKILFTSEPTTSATFPFNLSRSLTGLVMRGPRIIDCDDVLTTNAGERPSLLHSNPRAYLGAPLILGGINFGILEFSAAEPRSSRWTEEDFSILSAVSMMSCAYLGFFGYIETLRRSESALLGQLMDMKKRAGIADH